MSESVANDVNYDARAPCHIVYFRHRDEIADESGEGVTIVPNRTVIRRLLDGAAANFVGKLWIILVQLISIPLLTYAWGPAGYGIWLMLTTIPTYIALADFGINTVAAVEITTAHVKKDFSTALVYFQSSWLFYSFSSFVLSLLAACSFLTMSYFNLISIDETLTLTIVMISLYSFLVIQTSIVAAVYRSSNKYALGTLLADLLVPIEGAVVIGVGLLGGGHFGAAVALCLVRATGLTVYWRLLVRLEPWVAIGWRSASRTALAHLMKPSLGALSLTASSAVSIQGVVLAIGWTAEPAAVAVFSAARFLARAPLQFSGLLVRASLPELTRSLTVGDARLSIRLLIANVASTAVVTAPFAVVMGFYGPQLVSLLSNGAFNVENSVCTLLAFAAMSGAIWSAIVTPLAAKARYSDFAHVYLLISLAVVSAPFLLPQNAVLAASASLAAGEALMVVVAAVRVTAYLRSLRS